MGFAILLIATILGSIYFKYYTETGRKQLLKGFEEYDYKKPQKTDIETKDDAL
ncbi:hypothetical protein [Psychrobacter aestuarii]|uniref:Uncharacterized protein n=1 Tax=Psychrobacter aestuarii TaxID=556327 RepID=A0ABN0VZB2_9GAMM|nr:hypothetical protein [Psychrobacter aestuarii]